MRPIGTHDKYSYMRRLVQQNTEQYPQRVTRGDLTAEEAEYLLAVQRHICHDYEQALFGDEGEVAARAAMRLHRLEQVYPLLGLGAYVVADEETQG